MTAGFNFRLVTTAFIILSLIAGLSFNVRSIDAPELYLSGYRFFTGNLSDLTPADGVFEYEVNAPLFTDYAEKKRFIYLPAGTSLTYTAQGAFDFPAGSAIIKNFFYYNDASRRGEGKKMAETRILLKGSTGWKALTYVWNEAQSDANLEVAGAVFPVEWKNRDGKQMHVEYVVPNTNQCKGCHSFDGKFTPVGVNAAQLNRNNQLQLWADSGKLSQLPEPSAIPALFDYTTIEDPVHADNTLLEKGARAYLEGNCAHCHNPHGPASTSGMFLEAIQADRERLGIMKPPVAAGRGSGDRKFGIVPGKPHESILLYRMESTDPGIRMPELGRQLVHNEGITLIKAWIRSM
ncbi:MAG: SO2930 family diheme c-type cytochrome [Bacteroidota bacterium]